MKGNIIGTYSIMSWKVSVMLHLNAHIFFMMCSRDVFMIKVRCFLHICLLISILNVTQLKERQWSFKIFDQLISFDTGKLKSTFVCLLLFIYKQTNTINFVFILRFQLIYYADYSHILILNRKFKTTTMLKIDYIIKIKFFFCNSL